MGNGAYAATSISSTSPLPNGTEFTVYSFTFAAGGGHPPYHSWTVVSGSLPSGLSLDPNSGILSGTPVASGTFTFYVTVTDSQSQTSPQKKFSLTIKSACNFAGTSTGSITFGNIDPSTNPGPITNNTVTQQVLFQCDTSLTYSFATVPATPLLNLGGNSMTFVLGLAASGQNVTNTTQIPLLTTASSISKPQYQNAVAGSYSSGTISVKINWTGSSTGSLSASVTANGTVINTCTFSAPGVLTFNIDPSMTGTTSATIAPDLAIQCTNGDNSITISATSLNGGSAPELNCTSSSTCGSFQIPYTFKILNSNAWPVSAPAGSGFGGAATPMNVSGSVSSTNYAGAPLGTYGDTETVTISY